MNRPEWVHCVAHTHVDLKGKAWCGKELEGWHFMDAEHAAESGRKGGWLVACPECVASICLSLKNGHDELRSSGDNQLTKEVE